MALSGSFDISATRTIICQAAFRKLGVLAEGQTATSASVELAVEALNFMMKAWQSEGMPVWYLKTLYIYPDDEAGQSVGSVDLGPSGDHVSEELILTKLTDNAASGTSTITVSITSAVDVVGTTVNADNIGVELSDGTIHWTTISSGGGTATVVLASGLTGAAVSSNRVYAYTTKAQRPTELELVQRVEAATGDRIAVLPVSLSEILSQTSPTAEGPPIRYNYQATLTNGTFRHWPRFQDGKTYLELLAQNPFDDIDAATNNPAFPQEWYEALVYGLAVRLAPEYKLPLQERLMLKEEAKLMKDRAEMAAREAASIFLQPETNWTQR